MTSENLSVADIAAVTGNRNNAGFGYDGGGLWWIIILFLFGMFNGGWGGNGMNGGNNLYPWLNQQSQMSDGFQNQMLFDNISSIRDGVYGLGPQIQNGFAQAEIANNARQMADMNQMFGFQSVVQSGFCDNRAGIADLKYTVAQENCADRNQALLNTRDIMENCNRNYQGIMDKLCQLELDGVKGQLAQAQRDNVGLQNQLNMANFQASQIAQDQRIVDNIYNRLRDCPVDSRPVYGNTPIFTCNGNQGCSGNNFYN